MNRTYAPIPAADIRRAIHGCYSSCDAHACPNLATWWSDYFPGAFTGSPTRSRLCELHLRLQEVSS